VTGFKLSADNNCVEDLVFVKKAAGNESSTTENRVRN